MATKTQNIESAIRRAKRHAIEAKRAGDERALELAEELLERLERLACADAVGTLRARYNAILAALRTR